MGLTPFSVVLSAKLALKRFRHLCAISIGRKGYSLDFRPLSSSKPSYTIN
ncbi:hypothetical protein DsansV1_C06g0067451 [Dioscorea sansibarensis]